MSIVSRAMIAASAISIAGCSMFDPVRGQPLVSEVTARVVLTEDMPADWGGYADWDGELCTIYLRRSQYPYCMTHELRHCFEHYWHDDRPNQTDCMTQ